MIYSVFPASKENTQVSDEVTILAVKISMNIASYSVCDGMANKVDLKVEPTSAAGKLSNGSFTCQKPGGGASFKNPSGQGSQMIAAGGSDLTKWKIDNARWYSMQADHCNEVSPYEVVGSILVAGASVNVKKGDFRADSGELCLNGEANITKTFDGDPTYTTALNTMTNKWETTIQQGVFARDVKANALVMAPPNSQYRQMIIDEENFHKTQQFENVNHIRWGTCYVVANIINAVQAGGPYVAETYQQSEQAAKQAFEAAKVAENARSLNYANDQTRICADEIEAKQAVGVSYSMLLKCTYKNCP